MMCAACSFPSGMSGRWKRRWTPCFCCSGCSGCFGWLSNGQARGPVALCFCSEQWTSHPCPSCPSCPYRMRHCLPGARSRNGWWLSEPDGKLSTLLHRETHGGSAGVLCEVDVLAQAVCPRPRLVPGLVPRHWKRLSCRLSPPLVGQQRSSPPSPEAAVAGPRHRDHHPRDTQARWQTTVDGFGLG